MRGDGAVRASSAAWLPMLRAWFSLERKHATHQGLPGNRTNDSVYLYGRNGERKDLLKTAYRSVGGCSEDPIDLKSLAGIARQVTELELLLPPSNRVAPVSLFD